MASNPTAQLPDDNPYRSPLLSPGLSVEDTGNAGLWREGELLVMDKRAALPRRCTRCNAPTDLRMTRKLSWHRPLYFLLILVSIWIYVIVALLARWTATIEIGYCLEHRKARTKKIWIGLGVMALGIALCVGGAAAANVASAMAALLGLGAIAILGGLIFSARSAQVVTPKRINQQFIWLKQVCPEYLADLPQWVDQT